MAILNSLQTQVLKESSLILEEKKYLKFKNLIISKKYFDARLFIDSLIEFNKESDELLSLKKIEDLIYQLTNN